MAGVSRVPLVRASVSIPGVRFLRRIGAPAHRFLERSRLPNLEEDPEGFIPLKQAVEPCHHVVHGAGIENSGVLAAQEVTLRDLGVFGAMVCQSATVGDCITAITSPTFTRFSSVRYWTVDVGREHVALCSRLPSSCQLGRASADAYSTIIVVNTSKAALGTDWNPQALWTDHDPSVAPAFAGIADSPIQFGLPCSGVVFRRSALAQPIPRFWAPPPTTTMLSAWSGAPGSFSESVQLALQAASRPEEAAADRRAAGGLLLSVRTTPLP